MTGESLALSFDLDNTDGLNRLCREEEGSKWLYGIDMMAPLEI